MLAPSTKKIPSVAYIEVKQAEETTRSTLMCTFRLQFEEEVHVIVDQSRMYVPKVVTHLI